MAAIATASITITVTVDVGQVDIYYLVQSSTLTPPSKPTEASPSGWSTTEPSYDGTSTNTLYTCQKTTLTDGTFYWSAVSRSSSYEASKSAWNKADSAQGSANSAVLSTVPIYYRLEASSDMRPSSPASRAASDPTTVGTSTVTSNAWEYAMPRPKKGCFFWAAEEYTHVGGTVTYSTAHQMDGETYASKWVSASDEAFIDGGAIYAHSVTADEIDSNDLHVRAANVDGRMTAKQIDAEGLTIGKKQVEGLDEAVSEAAGLSYGLDWTLTQTQTRSATVSECEFCARAYKGGVDITSELPDEFFKWFFHKGDGSIAEITASSMPTGASFDQDIGPRKLTLPASLAGYRSQIIGGIEDSVEYMVCDSAQTPNLLADSDGNILAAVWVA